MNVDRMNELADLIYTIPYEKLDMRRWINECGTVCCALGWAAQHEPFVKQGLQIKGKDETLGLFGVPAYLYLTGYQAAMMFFRIDLPTAEYLFSPDAYFDSPSPKEVAERIREVVQAHERSANHGG